MLFFLKMQLQMTSLYIFLQAKVKMLLQALL